MPAPWRRRRPAARSILLLLLLAAPSACATAGRDSSRAATVTLRESRASAVRRTLDAFREQGYRVKETLTSGSEIVSEPFDHDRHTEAVFRATITEGEREARIRLTGTYREKSLGGLVKSSEREVRRATEGVEGALWARLQNLALAIRSAP